MFATDCASKTDEIWKRIDICIPLPFHHVSHWFCKCVFLFFVFPLCQTVSLYQFPILEILKAKVL